MIPAFLISFREVLEAGLIVVTILSILVKLNLSKNVKTVFLASFSAACVSVLILAAGSITGYKIQELYSGQTEHVFEGVLMLISAVFITWSVFWLHKYFAKKKLLLLQKIKQTINTEKNWPLFVLVFTAVLREGIEITLFLSTIYLSSSSTQIFIGFGLGVMQAILVIYLLLKTTLKIPVYKVFQFTTLMLVLFSAGLLTRGVSEFAEAGLIPNMVEATIYFLPVKGSFFADIIKTIFGWSRQMGYLQLIIYLLYIIYMRQYLLAKQSEFENIT